MIRSIHLCSLVAVASLALLAGCVQDDEVLDTANAELDSAADDPDATDAPDLDEATYDPATGRLTGTYCYASGTNVSLGSGSSGGNSGSGKMTYSGWTWNGDSSFDISVTMTGTSTTSTTKWASAGIYLEGSSTPCNWIGTGTGTAANPATWTAACYDQAITAPSVTVKVYDVASKGARFEFKSGSTTSQLYVPMSKTITMKCVTYDAGDGEEPPFVL